jgi:hypothetical protein
VHSIHMTSAQWRESDTAAKARIDALIESLAVPSDD